MLRAMTDAPALGPLDGIRVIDLADARAELAGRVLADLGAEVLRVEPPGGSPSRLRQPFEDGREQDPDGSLYWASVALGKRSVVLDITAEADRERLRALLAGADIFVESGDPGALDALGLGFGDMHELNPTLIYVSVTPWGQDGPLVGRPTTDLTLEAAGGLLSLQGDGDRPPVPVGYPQAAFHAGVQAAADAVIALNERQHSGLGQHLDVSMQAAVVWTLMNATGYPPNEHRDPPGKGDDRAGPPVQRVPGVTMISMIECADGVTYINPARGAALAGVLDWAEQEGELPGALHEIEVEDWPLMIQTGALTAEQYNDAFAFAASFIAGKTKRELQQFFFFNDTATTEIYTAKDIADDHQLEARDYWRTVDGRRHPGIFARMSRTPIDIRSGAPALDEGRALLDQPRERPSLPARGKRPQTFDGLKVADFTWVGVGPIIVKALADHGAEVVHVESSTRVDVLRNAPPYKDGEPHIDHAQFMANFNSSKSGIALNLATEGGRGIAHELIEWADVVAESFTPGTMKKLGLDWETISEGRPELIMLSSCLRGQTGPERSYGGFGTQGAALAGLHGITGWPDRPPAGPWGAYTDFIAPRYGVAALAAALYERDRSGLGQYIDLSQVEAAIHFMEPLILDYTVNGRVAPPSGHDSLTECPHGVYRAAGTERYVAIAVESAQQWQALRSQLPGLAAFEGAKFDDLAARRAEQPAIDRAISEWCAEREAGTIAEQLCAAGAPASAVLRPSDLYVDAQLAHREFFVTLDHSVMGPTPYDGPVTHFSETPSKLHKPGPALGEHTEYVLSELLGLSPDAIAAHAAAGALS
jgi:crotonobetainyl-CoA:carnitine CoA-transferase CaiB-like acyl-CoA transferase